MKAALGLAGLVLLATAERPLRADSIYGNDPLTIDVLVLSFDPIVQAGRTPRPRPLHPFAGWQDPRVLADHYAANVCDAHDSDDKSPTGGHD